MPYNPDYHKSEKGKAAWKRYTESDKGIATRRRWYKTSVKGQIATDKYYDYIVKLAHRKFLLDK